MLWYHDSWFAGEIPSQISKTSSMTLWLKNVKDGMCRRNHKKPRVFPASTWLSLFEKPTEMCPLTSKKRRVQKDCDGNPRKQEIEQVKWVTQLTRWRGSKNEHSIKCLGNFVFEWFANLSSRVPLRQLLRCWWIKVPDLYVYFLGLGIKS